MSNRKRPQGRPQPYPYEQPRTNSTPQLLILKARLEQIVESHDPQDRDSEVVRRYVEASTRLKSVKQQLGELP